ncbi:hypothetical protein CWB89_19675 [Pseudoalteromonas piscicida]|uniref:Uncharacterized protein n=1 Tax=Pseudoalteromonas piscicida TaxID=43662 RepID=A0AAQ2EWP1_PSEO7|nr:MULTISPECIES: hypothetical protein [Pseudoalteromonas]KJY89559.1 hypothetical protein TW75_09920 [Pseudoalteromonas piscicida]TMN33699.1 hypothetical protein CWB95_22360 [Pseudoalteromonas piscicida]TMN42125.1 hypothetical protein CWB94_06195 [Pseudoalteromonas piscicida]TMN48589.1 hypothetical protein CWB92_17645 [Pseudoalteromonas piscicida]TMN53175.1 hypothetical protein CWB91_10530 [Pseudoalteromonas piscicida]
MRDLKYLLSKTELHSLNETHSDIPFLKRNTNIAIIDDEDFPELDSFRNSGFQVTQYHDINSFDQLQSYPVIVCDIQGVGKNFGHSGEGAYIVQELKLQYPDKYIIVVSSKAASITISKMTDCADEKIIRGNNDALMAALNNGIQAVGSKVQRWKRLRNFLITQKDMDLFELWKLEQQFINAMKNNSSNTFEKYVTKHSSDVAKGMLINFISSLVF